MTSHLQMNDISTFNKLETDFTADPSLSSSSATADTTKTAGTKTSVRRAGKTEAKTPAGENGKVVRRSWKKPKDKPKRPLSAYNLFFQSEREKLVGVPSRAATKRRRREAHGKIGFADLARNISAKWKKLDASSRAPFEARADVERERYKREVEEWKRGKEAKEALQQQVSMLLDSAPLMPACLQNIQETLPASNPIDMNAMVANFLARTTADMRILQQLRAATVLPDGAGLHHPMAALSMATEIVPPTTPSTSMGQGTISIGSAASFQKHGNEDDDLGCMDPMSGDASDSSEPDFDTNLQNDVSQLDSLDAFLDTFNTQEQHARNDSFDVGEVLPLRPDDSTGLQQMMNATNADESLSLNSLIDDFLDSSDEIDRELSAYLKDGLTSSSSNLSVDDIFES